MKKWDDIDKKKGNAKNCLFFSVSGLCWCILLLVLLFFLSYCVEDTDVTGKYYSKHNEKGVLHYVELFSDSTFLHLYTKGNIRLEHRGTWRLYDYEHSKSIYFSEWKEFGYSVNHSPFPNIPNVTLKYGQLFFDMDDYDLNFMKE